MADSPPRPLWRDLLLGTLGFAACSVAAYAPWAFGHRWFAAHGGDALLYPVIAALYLVLPAFVLHPLAGGRTRFAAVFLPSFLAYAAAWCGAYFLLKGRTAEGAASAAGAAAFTWTACAIRRKFPAFPLACLVFFAAHSAGYFAGAEAYARLRGSAGMLAWGLFHGLGMGAGIGWTFRRIR